MNNTYRTKDLSEAAFLMTKGLPLNSLKREGKTCWFIFADEAKCKTLSSMYWFQNAEIPAKLFVDSIQTLKNRIFSQY